MAKDIPICSDCGLTLVNKWGKRLADSHLKKHPDVCCDCFDERFGMPAKQRSRPRPVKEGSNGSV